MFLLIAIVIHKIIDAFTLVNYNVKIKGLALIKADVERKTLIRLILLFSVFTPFGIFVGIELDNQNGLIISTFMAISTGTFIFISTSSIIVEEFSFTIHRYTKFFLYVLGGIFMACLIASIKLNSSNL